MRNTITPAILMERIKNFGGSNVKFMAALEPASNKGFQQFSKKNLNDMDDCVREEEAFNIVLEKLLSDSTIKVGNKEKQLIEIAYFQYRENLSNKNIDITEYDLAYKELLNLI